MIEADASRAADLAGFGRLAFDAVTGLTDVVEAMHGTIARRPLPFGGAAATRTRGITRFVYQTIRSVTRVAGSGVDAALALAPATPAPLSPRRDALVSALAGIIGDHLASTGNPLAIPMRFRRGGVPIEPRKLADATGRVAVLVHGLCMSDLQWARAGHDHGEALARSGWTPVYLHYNSGRHISTNGRELASRLEELAASWPVPIEELVVIGHSMGGLVARSACHHAAAAGHRWLARASKLVFLGTPHHGAPLERAGNLFDLVLELSPYAAPLARIGGNRSAGITDLRFGNVLDEHWAGQPRRRTDDPRTPVPLPDGIACFAIAGTRSRRRGDVHDRLLGDGLVPVASALGEHAEPGLALAFPAAHRRVFTEHDHFDLLSSPAVFAQLAEWLG